jgi:signal transduction histidine kinase
MLLALVWWTILLRKKNDEIWRYETSLYAEEMKSVFGVKEYKIDTQSEEYKKIINKRNRQNLMVVGEGLVFGLSLMMGFWLVYRAYLNDLKASERQNNFLLSVTHELKSPLTAIKLGFETLRKRQMPFETVADISNSSLKESERLEKLINDILTATKVESSYSYEFKTTNVSALLQEKIDHFRRSNPSLNIVFENSLPTQHTLYCDKSAIEIILSNLLDNAVKYGEGTPINVKASVEEFFTTIAVEDQGIAIPEKERTEIFKKFYRIGSEHVRKSKGTGLGLYITKKMVEAHGGKIAVKPNNSKGNIFEIKIPNQK